MNPGTENLSKIGFAPTQCGVADLRNDIKLCQTKFSIDQDYRVNTLILL